MDQIYCWNKKHTVPLPFSLTFPNTSCEQFSVGYFIQFLQTGKCEPCCKLWWEQPPLGDNCTHGDNCAGKLLSPMQAQCIRAVCTVSAPLLGISSPGWAVIRTPFHLHLLSDCTKWRCLIFNVTHDTHFCVGWKCSRAFQLSSRAGESLCALHWRAGAAGGLPAFSVSRSLHLTGPAQTTSAITRWGLTSGKKKTAAPTGVWSAYVNFSHSTFAVYFPINNVKQHQYLGWKPTRKPKGTMVRQKFQQSLLFTKDLHCSRLSLTQGFGPQAARGTFEWKLKVKASWKSRATLWGPAVLMLGIFHGIVMLVLLLSHSYIFCDKRDLLAQDVLAPQLHCFPGHI